MKLIKAKVSSFQFNLIDPDKVQALAALTFEEMDKTRHEHINLTPEESNILLGVAKAVEQRLLTNKPVIQPDQSESDQKPPMGFQADQ